jgi:hypothetical protein
MIGPVVLAAALLYLLIFIAVVRWAIRYARNNGRNTKRWGWSAALAMYLIPFWDWLPTVATHQFHCARVAGFWVYKSLDQWKAENPEVVKTLVATRDAPSANGAYILNQRFNWVVKKTGPLLFNLWRWEQQVVDSKTNEMLARYIDFSTGNGNIGGEPPIKFWLQTEHCIGGAMNDSRLSHFSSAAKYLSEGKNK